MDALTPVLVRPTDARLAPLIDTHLQLMWASSPACSVHAMQAEDLDEAAVDFLAVFDGEVAVAMGALKALSGSHGELKSMHVLQARRGAGLADRILSALLELAREKGLERVSLETGSQPPFAAARGFYERNGFDYCPPFEGYEEDPNSVFMTRLI